jgi:[ribosomal protein S5]-alanine N-acetyltransferase
VTIRLAPVALEHAPAVQALASDPEVLATTRLPEPYPPDGAVRFIERVAPRHAAGEEFAFAVVDETGALVGVCGFHDVRESPRRAELGYWIGRPYWGRGYASAAVAAMVRIAFDELGLAAIEAHSLADNVASRRVLEKNGFALEGLAAHEVSKWSAERLVARYGLRRP